MWRLVSAIIFLSIIFFCNFEVLLKKCFNFDILLQRKIAFALKFDSVCFILPSCFNSLKINDMKRLIGFFCVLVHTVLFADFLINAQPSVFAGHGKSVAQGSLVQLNAIPVGEGTWEVVSGLDGYNIQSLCYASDSTVFAAASGGYILKSVDSGKTWSAKLVDSGYSFGSIAFYDHLNGVASSISSAIFKTADGGETWTKTFSGGNFKFGKIKYISKSTILVTDAGSIFRSYDGGTSWTMFQNLSAAKGIVDFIANPKGDMLCLFSGGRVSRLINYDIDSLNLYSGYPPLRTGVFINNQVAVVIGNTSLGHIHYDDHMGFPVGYTKLPVDSVFEETTLPNGTIVKSNGIRLFSLSFKSVSFITDQIGYVTAVLSGNSYVLKTNDGGNHWKIDKKFEGVQIASSDVYNSEVLVAGNNGFIARYVSAESATDTYSWTPAAGLDNSQIKNPVVTVTQPAEYTVTRNHQGKVYTSKVMIDVEPLKILSVGSNAFGCAGSVPLEYVRTNYNGAQTLTYQWSPSRGLSADNVPDPVFTHSSDIDYEMENAVYSLTVSIPNGESVSKQIIVTRKPLYVNAGASKVFICGTSAQGNRLGPVYTNYSGNQPLTYRWYSGSQELANEPNPVVPVPAKTTTYRLEVSSPDGCFEDTTVTVNVSQPTVSVGADKTISCGNSVSFDPLYTNLKSTGTLSYLWTPSAGLSSDTIPNPVASPLVTTTYVLTVTSSAGCSASDAVVVNVTMPTISAGADKTTSCNTPVQLGPVSSSYSGTAVLKYNWTPATGLSSDTVENPIATVSNTTEYTLTITNELGCSASAKMKVIITSPNKPIIDFVGVNSSNKNVVNWTRSNDPSVSAYRVYKETNVANTFVKIADITDNNASAFVDTLSFPDVQSNSYRLAMVDACGTESGLSERHKTMHLSINQGINGNWNLIWEQYQGFPVSTYNIFRGTSRTDIRQIGSLSGNNSQFTDFTAPTGYVYYQIEAVGTVQSAAPGMAMIKGSGQATAVTSRSNIATNQSQFDGLFDLMDNSSSLSVYPNPASGKFKVSLHSAITAETVLRIYDLSGQLVHLEPILANYQEIVLQQPRGVYFIVVESGNTIARQKLVLHY
jgi:photosystem II stability/assembly factor-like uncharacterized protein